MNFSTSNNKFGLLCKLDDVMTMPLCLQPLEKNDECLEISMPGGKRPELPPPPRLLQVPGGLPGREGGVPPSQSTPAMHQSPVSPLHLHSRPKSPTLRESHS